MGQPASFSTGGPLPGTTTGDFPLDSGCCRFRIRRFRGDYRNHISPADKALLDAPTLDSLLESGQARHWRCGYSRSSRTSRIGSRVRSPGPPMKRNSETSPWASALHAAHVPQSPRATSVADTAQGGADRFVADPELHRQGAQARGAGQGTDSCLLLGRQFASAADIEGEDAGAPLGVDRRVKTASCCRKSGTGTRRCLPVMVLKVLMRSPSLPPDRRRV